MSEISVVMPTFNRMNFIKEAIDSVLLQSFSDWELIIVDDGSKDGTGDFIKKNYHDERIKYHYQDNQGEYQATNKGMKLADSKYIAWLHSDDYLPKDSLESRYKFFENNLGCDFIHGDIIKVDASGNVLKKLTGSDLDAKEIFDIYCKKYYEGLLKGNPCQLVHHLSFLIKNKFFDNVGYLDEKLFHAGDFDWFLRALKNAKKIKHLPHVVYYYRTHPGSKRVTDAKVVNENQVVKDILDKNCN